MKEGVGAKDGRRRRRKTWWLRGTMMIVVEAVGDNWNGKKEK